jgi:hypothetical protein
MNLPGFTAEASVYATQNRYLTGHQSLGSNRGVALAGMCTCADPECTSFSCSSRPDPDCEGACVGGVDTQRCCDCTGGIWDPVRHRCE